MDDITKCNYSIKYTYGGDSVKLRHIRVHNVGLRHVIKEYRFCRTLPNLKSWLENRLFQKLEKSKSEGTISVNLARYGPYRMVILFKPFHWVKLVESSIAGGEIFAAEYEAEIENITENITDHILKWSSIWFVSLVHVNSH